jgi:hypothetical protein
MLFTSLIKGKSMSSQVLFQLQSTFILLLMYIGVYYRQFPARHVKFMAITIAWDLILVLQIELSRGAIKKAAHSVVNPTFLTIHITIAVSTVLLYFGMIYTGRKMLKKDYSVHKLHRLMGRTTVLFRTATYVTSFFVV